MCMYMCALSVLTVWECQLEKYSQPKFELCFIWREFLGFQARETASQVSLREVLRGGEGKSQVI